MFVFCFKFSFSLSAVYSRKKQFSPVAFLSTEIKLTTSCFGLCFPGKNCCKPVTSHGKSVASLLQATGRILMTVVIASDNVWIDWPVTSLFTRLRCG